MKNITISIGEFVGGFLTVSVDDSIDQKGIEAIENTIEEQLNEVGVEGIAEAMKGDFEVTHRDVEIYGQVNP